MAIIRRNTHFLVPLLAPFIASLKRTLYPAVTASAVVERFVNPAAAGVGVHAAIASDNAAAVTTGITNPAIPRSVQIVFHASWDGGDVTIVGTNQFDQAQTEVIADTAGSTVQGVKVWKTITSLNQQTVGAGGTAVMTVQTGTKLGLLYPLSGAYGVLLTDDAAEAATWDATYSAFTPTTAPNGTHDYTVQHNVNLAPAHYDRGEYTVATANASNLATSLALTKALMAAYYSHRTDTEAHTAADATNTVAATIESVVDLATAITAANQLKAAYNAHLSLAGVHPTYDSTNTVAATNASDQSSLNTLLNEMKADFNAHIADGLAFASWRVIDS